MDQSYQRDNSCCKRRPDPDDNPRLRLALDKANAANMPKDNIKRAIEKGSGTGETGALEEIVLEGYGPGGVAILVEAMSDNRNRTVLMSGMHFLSLEAI